MKANVSVTCTNNQILISEGKDLTSPSMSLLLLISTFVTEPNFENLKMKGGVELFPGTY